MGVEVEITIAAEVNSNRQETTCLTDHSKLDSIVAISFEKRLSMRPVGVVSRNLKLLRSKQYSSLLCRYFADLIIMKTVRVRRSNSPKAFICDFAY